MLNVANAVLPEKFIAFKTRKTNKRKKKLGKL